MERKSLIYSDMFVLAFVLALLLLSGLNQLNVNLMEARNFVAAREMVTNDSYLLTTLNGLPRYEKPPLPTWLTALSGSLFGFDSLFAMRLPVVVITMLLVFVFYFYSKTLGLSEKHSLYASLILITSFYVFFSGRDNQWDMYTHSFMMTGVLFLTKLFDESRHRWRNCLIAGMFIGFSVLSKGPVSFYAVLLPFMIAYAFVYHIAFKEKWPYLAVALLVGLALGLSWYVYVHLKDPETFRVVASRETSNWTGYEVKPFYYYWSFFLQSGLWAIPALISLAYPYLKTRVSNPKAYRFALVWTLLALVFLSAIPEKKVRYLVPVLIPLALTTSFYIEYLFRAFNSGMAKWEKSIVYFISGLIAIIGFAYPLALALVLKTKIMQHLPIGIISSVLMVIFAVIIVCGLFKNDFRRIFYAMIAIFATAVVALIPLFKEIDYNTAYAPTNKVLEIEKEYGLKTYSLSTVAPEIVWDFGKPIPVIGQVDSLVNQPVESQFALMVDPKDSASFVRLFPGYESKKLYRVNLSYRKKTSERVIKDVFLVSKSDNFTE